MTKFVLATLALCGAATANNMSLATVGLAGSWELIGAYREHRDGSRSDDYGVRPRGTLTVSGDGRYALQIYHTERSAFAGDFRTADPQEFKRLLLTMSAHFGTVAVEEGRLVFRISAASNPQWDGAVQRRAYSLVGDVLEWRVPPRPDGDVPISVWRRIR